jgi:peptide/nickel transport system substrate-binding protein
MKRNNGRLALAAVLALVVVAVTAATVSASSSKKSSSLAGGTYRVGVEAAFGYTGGLDPTGEYAGDYWGVLENLMVRALLGTNHVPGAAGNTLVPDLATSVPTPTNGGKTYTFKLKSGIKFGPPVSREITSKDVLAALERIGRVANGAQYAIYYQAIQGFDAYSKGKAKTISGIKTPDDKTIVVNLVRPTGDFLYRMSMPATAPIPTEVTKCFEGKAGIYGRNIVSTAGYMIEGSDSLDASSCKSLKQPSGFDGKSKLILVRNPDYAKSTDKTRDNFPDRFEFRVNTNTDDIYNKVKAGELDDEIATEPPKVLREYTTSSSLKPRLKQFFGDRVWYIPMTMTQPPFDDVHVRKAMNWVMDKNAIRKSWGGPIAGSIANHFVPDTLFNFQLKGYRPFKTPGDAGSVAKAKAEMKQSKYDRNKDGICDASECKGVLMIADARSVDPGMVAVIQSSSAKIGITYTVRTIAGAYPTIQTPSKNVAISDRPGWAKDYADAVTMFEPLMYSTAILKSGNTNYSLVGLTPAIAKAIGAGGNVNNVPGIDKDLAHCAQIAGDARRVCYQNIDKKVTGQIANVIPWLWAYATYVIGPDVTKWTFDQGTTAPAYSHVAVKG